MTDHKIDTSSETWRAVKEWAEKEIGQLTDQLKVLGTQPDETEGLRHAIAKLEELIALTADRPSFAKSASE